MTSYACSARGRNGRIYRTRYLVKGRCDLPQFSSLKRNTLSLVSSLFFNLMCRSYLFSFF